MKEFIAKKKAQRDPHPGGRPHRLRDLKFLNQRSTVSSFFGKEIKLNNIWFWLFIKKKSNTEQFSQRIS